jgi:hypothetical protein
MYGGHYQMPDALTDELWTIGVEETRRVIEGPWLGP